MEKPRLAVVSGACAVGVGVGVGVGAVAYFFWLHVLVDPDCVVVLGGVSPIRVRVRPWAVRAPVIATNTAAWRNVVARREPVERH